MKKLLLLAVIGFAVYQGWDKINNAPQPLLYSAPYVAVYGRNSCGFTQKMLADLRRAGVNYRYLLVDNTKVADSLHVRMEASGISTRRYNLPVVDVNGYLSVRPELGAVLDAYHQK